MSRPMTPGYEHTQRAPLWLLLGLAVVGLAVTAARTHDLPVRIALTGMTVLLALLAFSFAHLRVVDRGDHLAVRFGPLPLWGTRLRYRQMQSVRIARSRWIDGWGVHWVPGRGWTFNLWGFDCVEVACGRSVLRIGSDDAAGLAAFLQSRLGPAG